MEGGSVACVDVYKSLESKVQPPGAHFYGLVALRNGCQAPFPRKSQGYWCFLAKIQVLVAKGKDKTDCPRASAGVWGSNSADTTLAKALPAINEV